jgi:hypothetical protein
MSRSVAQTVHLLDGTKIVVVDSSQDEAPVYALTRLGATLPKKTTPGPEHVFVVKQLAQPAAPGVSAKAGPPLMSLKLTRNEKGTFKQYWDEAKDGPKPVNPNAKKRVNSKKLADAAETPAKKAKEDKDVERITKAVIAALAAQK